MDPRTKIIKIGEDGKSYLPHEARIGWIREEHPDWSIRSEANRIEFGSLSTIAIFRTTVEDGNGSVIATGWGTAADTADIVERAETKSIDRALGFSGYNTESAMFYQQEVDLSSPFCCSQLTDENTGEVIMYPRAHAVCAAFRRMHPYWRIETELTHHMFSAGDKNTQADAIAVFECVIKNEDGRIVSTGHGHASLGEAPSYVENAETKAVRRAFVNLGIVGDREPCQNILAEAPVKAETGKKANPSPEPPKSETFLCAGCGKAILPFTNEHGKEYSVEDILRKSRRRYRKNLCPSCYNHQLQAERDAVQQ